MGANLTRPIGRSAGSKQGDEGPGRQYLNSSTRDTVQQSTHSETTDYSQDFTRLWRIPGVPKGQSIPRNQDPFRPVESKCFARALPRRIAPYPIAKDLGCAIPHTCKPRFVDNLDLRLRPALYVCCLTPLIVRLHLNLSRYVTCIKSCAFTKRINDYRPATASMYQVKEARFLAPDIKLLKIEAPRIARKRKAGQFVIVRVHDHGERIPLTIADSDAEAGTITIIVQGVGKTTKLINMLDAGDVLLDVVGPLGNASDVRKFGTVVVIGGGVGTAIAYPTAVAMKKAGNRVLSIIGARTKELLILENEMRATSDELFVMTDDGSYGQHGFVTQKLEELIASRATNRSCAGDWANSHDAGCRRGDAAA